MIVNFRKYFYAFSMILVVSSVITLSIFGLRLGTDFVGGSLLEIQFVGERPSQEEIRVNIEGLELGDVSIRNAGESNIILRFNEIDEPTHQRLLSVIPNAIEMRFDSIGPAIGKEAQRKSVTAIVLVVVMILGYVAWAFRKISYPLGSFRYGLIALVALFHDVLITVGIFAVLGHIFSVEIGVAFVAAILTILGYSVNDTIVVFDRIRENLFKRASNRSFDEIINSSIRETAVRSLATSATTLIVLITIFLFGGETIRYFVLTLAIGVVVGTYSSLFLASPLLLTWHKWRIRKS